MKNIKWSSLFIGLICLCSCVDLTELNENPTKATSISPHLLIPTIQLTHSQYMQNTIRYFIYPGAFVNHWIGGWSMQEYGGKAKKNIAYMERLWVECRRTGQPDHRQPRRSQSECHRTHPESRGFP